MSKRVSNIDNRSVCGKVTNKAQENMKQLVISSCNYVRY